MDLPPTGRTATTLQQALTTSGRWIHTRGDGARPSSGTPRNTADAGPATQLLDAAARMLDSSDPQVARLVIAGEALRLAAADGVILLDPDKNGLTLALHLSMASDRAGLDSVTPSGLGLVVDQLLEPGHVPAALLEGVQLALLGGAVDTAAPAPWRSALVADLDQPRTRRPTRLLWYAATADAFTTSGDFAVLFARHAGLALQCVTERHHLQQAVESRTVTGQATGILMHRHHLTAEQAFEFLRRYSQEHHRKVRDIADTIIRTGAFPT